jgi:hypothetical protein
MQKKFRKFRSFAEAEEAEIQEQIALTPSQRLNIFHQLKIRIYGRRPIDIRAFHAKKK